MGGVSAAACLPVTPLGPMIRDLDRQRDGRVKDKTYRYSPVGGHVWRWLNAYRWSDASPDTLDAYELVGARLAIDHDDFSGLDQFCSPVGSQYIEEFLVRHWGDAAKETKRQRRAILKSLFAWAVDQQICAYNPVERVRRVGGGRRRTRLPQPRSAVRQLITSQDSLRDQCAIGLLCRLALRKNDLRLLQIRDVDLTRNVVVLRHGKGGAETLLPIEYADLRQDLYLHIVGQGRGPDEYLIYPRQRRLEPMDRSSVHRWFKRCLEQAELPAAVKMHELRHTAGDEMWRVTGNLVLAQQLLRHESVGTTQEYLHPNSDDVRGGMRAVARAWEADE